MTYSLRASGVGKDNWASNGYQSGKWKLTNCHAPIGGESTSSSACAGMRGRTASPESPDAETRDLGDLVGDLEDVAKRIPHHGATVPVGRFERLLHRDGPGVERPAIGRIRIIDVDIQERLE